ncbi:MAG: M13 family metallopeptidase [Bryobacteraceae bacterium]|nr:M13 family metallopeptidase [Bryobacteraceae bacterium]
MHRWLRIVLLPCCVAAQETKWIDRAADPCADFYQFACGGWMRATQLSGGRSRWSRFDEARERNLEILRSQLEKDTGRAGDFYASCMDQAAIARNDLTPAGPLLKRILELKDRRGIPALLASLHIAGVNALFGFGSEPDLQDAALTNAVIDQGGLGLPDRRAYFQDTSLTTRYEAHVERTLVLGGVTVAQGAALAKAVVRIEAALAQASLDEASRQDPARIYNPMPRREAFALAPEFDFEAYLKAAGAPPFETVNVSVPGFVRQINRLLSETGMEAWRAYFAWALLRDSASLLPARLDEESFAFYGRTLLGEREMMPRWKRCAGLVERQLPQASDRLFIARALPDATNALRMAREIAAALDSRVPRFAWLSEEARAEARRRIESLRFRIGQPTAEPDGEFEISRGDALGNLLRANESAWRQDLKRIGKKREPETAAIPAAAPDAAYDPETNTLVFAAGLLQPPFYAGVGPGSYGSAGALMARELSRLIEPLPASTECLEKQMGTRETLASDVADQAGLLFAWLARPRLPGRIAGFTSDQRFLLAWAQTWCETELEVAARERARIRPYTTVRRRVNVGVSNLPEFPKAFACGAGLPLTSGPACRVW